MMRLIVPVRLCLALLLAESASPQISSSQNSPASDEPVDPLGRSTPYSCVLNFLKAANRGNYETAAQYLQKSSGDSTDLTRQLETVLDLGLSTDLSQLSRQSEGSHHDGLSSRLERVGTIDYQGGRVEIILEQERPQRGPPIWLFSAETLRQIPKAYEALYVPLFEHAHFGRFLAFRILSIPIWHWLTALFSIGLALGSATMVTRWLIRVLRLFDRRFTGGNEEIYLKNLKVPIRLVLLALVSKILSQKVAFLLGRRFWGSASSVLGIVGLAWLVIRVSDALSDAGSRRLIVKGASEKIAVLALAQRLFKIIVVLAVAIALLRQAGVDVTAVLAGIGVGGIAVALAAQKTIENIFGGVAMIAREAVRVGDQCKIGDQIGTVEDIGLSSTRVRTLDRTVLSVPNAMLLQSNIENLSLRDKYWFHHVFGLRYDTTAAQMRDVLSHIESLLTSNSKVEAQSARVRFLEFGESSVKLELFAYINESAYETFLLVQQNLLIEILNIVAAAGTNLAIPSQLSVFEHDPQKGPPNVTRHD